MPGITGASDWLRLFELTGFVTPVEDDNGVCVWSLSTRNAALLAMNNEDAFRYALFQVPEYRRYLVGILAENLATAAKHEMYDQIEAWTGNELLSLLDDINRVFDDLEIYGRRLIDEITAQITTCFDTLPERKTDWTVWNQLLLSGTGRSQELFDFVLRRFVPNATIPVQDHDGRVPALLPSLPLFDADGNVDVKNRDPAPWNICRTSIHSSIALFNERGKPLVDIRSPEGFRQTLQDTLLEQPFYKATVHLAISTYRSYAAMTPAVELFLPHGEFRGAVAVFFEGNHVGPLQELLPDLLCCQNCFSVAAVSVESIAAMLENLLALEILQYKDDIIVLHPDFQSSLMADRLRTVYRPGKALQTSMLEVIEHYARAGGEVSYEK